MSIQRWPSSTSRLRIIQSAWLVAGLAVVWIGCGGGGKGPASTLDRYSAALRKQDYATAYGLMSSSYRDQHSKEEFVRMMEDNLAEATDTAARLRQAQEGVEITAEFRFGLGDSMRMVLENGRWRIASNPVLFYSQTTPREALRSFIRAYRLKRWDVMLRLVPGRYREHMTPDIVQKQFEGIHEDEIEIMVNILEQNIDAPITEQGNEARMPYGDRYEVKFAREDGLWKVQDIDRPTMRTGS